MASSLGALTTALFIALLSVIGSDVVLARSPLVKFCEYPEGFLQLGEQVAVKSSSSCVQYLCTEEGHLLTAVPDCLPPMCVEPVTDDNSCCPRCIEGKTTMCSKLLRQLEKGIEDAEAKLEGKIEEKALECNPDIAVVDASLEERCVELVKSFDAQLQKLEQRKADLKQLEKDNHAVHQNVSFTFEDCRHIHRYNAARLQQIEDDVQTRLDEFSASCQNFNNAGKGWCNKKIRKLTDKLTRVQSDKTEAQRKTNTTTSELKKTWERQEKKRERKERKQERKERKDQRKLEQIEKQQDELEKKQERIERRQGRREDKEEEAQREIEEAAQRELIEEAVQREIDEAVQRGIEEAVQSGIEEVIEHSGLGGWGPPHHGPWHRPGRGGRGRGRGRWRG